MRHLSLPLRLAAVLLLAFALVGSLPGQSRASSTERVSLGAAGVQGNAVSDDPAISADGRYVAFESLATNLVTGDTNNKRDIFVHDRQTDTTTRVSVSSVGDQADQDCENAVISGDGRYVAFDTKATTLVAADTNLVKDVFVHDRQTGTTTRVSVETGGGQRLRESLNAALSDDGRFVAFEYDRDGKYDILVHDRDTTTTVKVNVASDGTPGLSNNLSAALSEDGRYVAFESTEDALVAGDTNNDWDIFVHDRDVDEDEIFDEAGQIETTRVSVTSAGGQGTNNSNDPAISADGRYVVFQSASPNLVASDTNSRKDIFVRDRQAGSTIRVNTDSAGNQAIGQDSFYPAISADGRIVLYQTGATNLVPADTNSRKDIFIYDRDADADSTFDEAGAVATIRVSLSSADEEADDHSSTDGDPALSANGRFATFESPATNLVTGDTNNKRDVFVRDIPACGDTLISAGEECDDGNLTSGDGCDENCRFTACGNEVVTLGEGCDDGNLADGDGCDSNCTVTACGNDILTTGEVCDDGNLTDGDGCDSNCTVTACGNGVMTSGELCDDGNLDNGDGCDSNCTVTGCGNSVTTPPEVCDDGNLDSGDGCDANCTPTACGNGIATTGEECDDGNGDSMDACKNDCTLNVCGDAVQHVGVEECDDGDSDPTNECKNDCTLNVCGDGFQHVGVEECDDGDAIEGNGCDTNCTVTACGNGIVTTGETCDDGDLDSGDGCDENCTPTSCGNGVVTTGEVCDDGDLTDGDGCDSNCTPTGCGNGVQTAGEACDHGIDNGTDACCSASCVLVDADADLTCDAEDLSDLAGLSLTKAQIKDSNGNPTDPNGLALVKGLLDVSTYPPSGAASFFAQAKLTGFTLRLFAGPVPDPSDTPEVVIDVAPGDCTFTEVPGLVTRVRCKRVVEPEDTIYKLQLTRKPTGYQLTVSLKNADVFAPLAGPIHAVLDLNTPALLDHLRSVAVCTLTGTTRKNLTCKPS